MMHNDTLNENLLLNKKTTKSNINVDTFKSDANKLRTEQVNQQNRKILFSFYYFQQARVPNTM